MKTKEASLPRPTTQLDQTSATYDSSGTLITAPIIIQADIALSTSTTLCKDTEGTPSLTPGDQVPPAAIHAVVEASPSSSSSSATTVKAAAATTVTPSVKQRKVVIDLSSKTVATSEDSSAVVKPSDSVFIPVTLSASIVLEQSEKLLKKLLKVLHVCARYQRCTGKQLPDTIDFFGKTLLGMTSIRYGHALPCHAMLCPALSCCAVTVTVPLSTTTS